MKLGMKLRSILLLAALGLVPAHTSAAQEMRGETRVVAELFTSQGCSSCPPADAVLAELASRDDVLTLAYHVDYWDYIGWADTFADALYSDFQREYAQAWNARSVYTPQLIINGQTGLVGSHRTEVDTALVDATLPLAIQIDCDQDYMQASIAPNPSYDEAVVWLVTYQSRANVDIERGENRGKSIEYTQIVTSRAAVGVWDPTKGLDLKLPVKDVMHENSDGMALVLQQEVDGLPGPILAAAAVDF